MGAETPTAFDTTTLGGGAEVFAAANGLRYEASASAPRFGGAIFEYLQNASVSDRFTTIAGPHFEVVAITGTVGGSQSRPSDSGRFTVTTSYSSTERRTYGYIAMQLERALPQLVLDASSNNRRLSSSIPMPIAGGQKLALEGDFNTHFTLYCPRGYERDALYVFTPDLMALLIDETGDFDVEVVDDMLFVYSTKPFDLTDAAVWDRIHRIRATVGAKALRQTDAYSDDRTGTRMGSTVGEEGRRLRQGFIGASTGGKGASIAVIIGIFVGVLAIIGAVAAIVLTTVLPQLGL